MYRAFPRQLYGPRAKIETVFSVIKRKLPFLQDVNRAT
jgi:hypothetical protein